MVRRAAREMTQMAFMLHAHPRKQAEYRLRIAKIFIEIQNEVFRRP
jgi:L-rhamnose mutarotase